MRESLLVCLALSPQVSKHPRNRTIIYASELSQKADQFYDDILSAIKHADATIDRVKPAVSSERRTSHSRTKSLALLASCHI